VSLSSFYRPENIRKAARAIENENQFTRDFSRNAREALFQEAIDRGDLYDDAFDAAGRQGVDVDEVDLDPRSYLSVSDYPDYLPSPQGTDVDPDLENYTGYRLAQQNPKIRGFLSQPNVDVYAEDQGAVGRRFLNDYSQNLIEPEDWNSLRESFTSEVLDPTYGDLPTERQFDTADFVEREGTRSYSRGLDRDMYPGFSNLRDKVNYLDSLSENRRLIEQEESPTSPTRQQLVNARATRNSPDQLSFFNQEAEALNEFENRLRPSTPEQLNDPDYLDQRSRDIRQISSGINQIRYGPLTSIDSRIGVILDEMLPSVREALGERGANEAAQQQERTIRADRNLERQNQRFADVSPLTNLREYRRLPLREQQRYRFADLTSPEQRELLNPISRDFINIDQGNQLVVPGLVEDLRESKIKQLKQKPTEALARFEQVLDKYPEVRDLLSQEVKPDRAVPIKGEEFAPYLKYADQEQMFSTPEIRKDLYENVLLDVEPDLRPSLSQTLAVIESKYTSGNPLLQQEARQKINEIAGKQNILVSNEKLAFRPNRPVIGGGGYLNLSQPETREKFALIDKRAAEVNNALRAIYAEIPSDNLTDIYPGLKTTLASAAAAPVGFLLDEETGQVIRTLPSDNTYDIKVSKSGGKNFFLANSQAIPSPEKVSSNFLDFLVANPATSARGIMFETSRPGESLNFEAKTDIPAPITQAWEEEIKQQAFSNLRPNTIVYNSPVPSKDLYKSRLEEGLTEEQSSTIRKLKPFAETGQKLPNLRAISYSRGGFGPASLDDIEGYKQLAFITPQGKVLALQANPPEAGLKGKINIAPDKVRVAQSTLPFSSTPRYFSGDPVTGAALGALQMGQDLSSRSKDLQNGGISEETQEFLMKAMHLGESCCAMTEIN
jgi:hypothetical protein